MLLGLNPNDQDDLAKQLEQVLHFLNDHEVALAHIPYLIRLCPNDHEVALGRSVETFHRLVVLCRYANIAPEIPLTFAADFVRGVFDGDGYISKNKQPQIVIVATQMLCHWLQEVIKDAIGTAGTCALKKNTTFRWILSGRMNLSLFAKWIYQQNLDGAYPLCLERNNQRFIDAGLLEAT